MDRRASPRASAPTLDLIIPRDADGKLGDARPRWSRTPTPPGWSCTRTPCATRTPSCPPTSARGTDPNAYGDAFGPFKAYFDTGIDGIFTDNPRHRPAGGRGTSASD